MPQPHNQPLVLAERRQQVAALYLRGRTQHEIAAAVDVDQGTVSRDLAAIHDEWQTSAVADMAARKAIELAKIDALERSYHEAWERSCKERQTRKVKTVSGDRPREEKGMDSENRDGDPRFLDGVAWCVDRRCKLLGLDAATQHKLIGGGPVGELVVKVIGGGASMEDI